MTDIKNSVPNIPSVPSGTSVPKEISKYFSKIGTKGGKAKILDSSKAREMANKRWSNEKKPIKSKKQPTNKDIIKDTLTA